MSAQHSPTPWGLTEMPTGPNGLVLAPTGITDADGVIVAVAETERDASRIQQCVNACEELPDPSRLAVAIKQMRENKNPAFAGPAAMFLDLLGVSS